MGTNESDDIVTDSRVRRSPLVGSQCDRAFTRRPNGSVLTHFVWPLIADAFLNFRQRPVVSRYPN
jgi:hypothetical protein